MKKNMLWMALVLLWTGVLLQTAQAQDNCENGWCWGQDPATAKEKNALYNDLMREKKFAEAVEPLEWLLKNTPKLNKAIYINGVKIYDELQKTETSDAAKQEGYQMRLLELLDLRVTHYGEEAYVANKLKGYYAFNFLKKKTDKYPELYTFYKKIIELNGNQTDIPHLKLAMILAQANCKTKQINEEEMLSIYDRISNISDQNKTAKPEDKAKWDELQAFADQTLQGSCVKLDCDYVRNKMASDLKNKPDDIVLSKKALKYMLSGKCTDDPLFLIALQNIDRKEPDASTKSLIAKKLIAQKDIDGAIEYYKKAIELSAEDPAKRFDYLKELGTLYASRGRRSDARSQFVEAAKTDPSRAGEAYSEIGDMYMSSYQDCVQPNPVTSKACYLAAYEMYQRAGNAAGMSRAAQYFPTMADIHSFSQEGAQIEVGCWIGGTATVRKKP